MYCGICGTKLNGIPELCPNCRRPISLSLPPKEPVQKPVLVLSPEEKRQGKVIYVFGILSVAGSVLGGIPGIILAFITMILISKYRKRFSVTASQNPNVKTASTLSIVALGLGVALIYITPLAIVFHFIGGMVRAESGL